LNANMFIPSRAKTKMNKNMRIEKVPTSFKVFTTV